MRRSGGAAPRSSWWVWREGGGPAVGPMAAVEVAFLVHSGRAGPADLVVDGRTGASAVVGEHPALRRWLEAGRDREQKILRGALRLARARAAATGRPPRDCLPRWAHELLTPEQRRALRLLGLDLTAGPDERGRRYRALAKRHHPDRGGDHATMGALNEAFASLHDLPG